MTVVNAQQKTHTKLIGLALAGVLGVSAGAFVANILPAQPQSSGRAQQAWTDRLNA